MTNYESLLRMPIWRFVDESIIAQSRSALESFAADDTYCHLVGQQLSVPTVRTWVHDQTVVLGIQDHRLPFIQDVQRRIAQMGYESIVRNSGGLAVVLDKGILNISLIFSERTGKIDISTGYEMMLEFVRLLLPEAEGKIEAYEIVGSYCPGSYDLSIAGKKFAGISQRRLREGVAVQVYLCVEGDGAQRAEIIRQLYEIGQQGVATKFEYPTIMPEVMASLSQLLQKDITVRELVARSKQLVQLLSTNMTIGGFTEDEIELYTHYLQRVVKRNAKMLESSAL